MNEKAVKNYDVLYYIKIRNKEWMDFNAILGADKHTYYRAFGDKLSVDFKLVGKRVFVHNYGEAELLGIPDWAVEESYSVNRNDDPEFFI